MFDARDEPIEVRMLRRRLGLAKSDHIPHEHASDLELRVLRRRHALRQRQYLRGGFWPRINIYRHGCKPDALPALKFGLDRTYGPPISIYAQTRNHCAVFCWRFAPRPVNK